MNENNALVVVNKKNKTISLVQYDTINFIDKHDCKYAEVSSRGQISVRVKSSFLYEKFVVTHWQAEVLRYLLANKPVSAVLRYLFNHE